MDLNKKIKEQNRIVEDLNNKIDNLIVEILGVAGLVVNRPRPKYKSTPNTSGDYSGNVFKHLTKALSRISHDGDGVLDGNQNDTINTLYLKFDTPIKFIGDFNGKELSPGYSKAYRVNSYHNRGSKYIISLLGSENNSFIAKGLEDVELIIKLDRPIENIKGEIVPNLIQKNTKTGKEDDLSSVVMEITKYK